MGIKEVKDCIRKDKGSIKGMGRKDIIDRDCSQHRAIKIASFFFYLFLIKKSKM